MVMVSEAEPLTRISGTTAYCLPDADKVDRDCAAAFASRPTAYRLLPTGDCTRLTADQFSPQRNLLTPFSVKNLLKNHMTGTLSHGIEKQ